MELEAVSGCFFENITDSEVRQRHETQTVRCIFEDSLISNGVEGIYGSIITGISDSSSFLCSNTTFNDTFRSSSYSTRKEAEQGMECR